jgi:hypothetical protein
MEELTLEIPQLPDEETPYTLQLSYDGKPSVRTPGSVAEGTSVGVRGFACEAGVSGWRLETPTGLSGDGLPSKDNGYDNNTSPYPVITRVRTHSLDNIVRTPEKRRRSFVGVRGITGDGLPSKVIEVVSPGRHKKRHKRELVQIQKMLSVSHIHNPNKGSNDSQYSVVDDPDASESSKKKSQEHSHQLELYMEFFWCFSCCYSNPTFRNYFERIVIGYPNKSRDKNDNENNIGTGSCHYCNKRFYDCIYRVFFAPIFDNDESKFTKTQKLVILVRLSFEMYKTMIGSYLTIFTPQKCNEGICTLTQNLIPKDNMEIVALAVNSFMAFALICEYLIELSREKILRLYFENDPRLPVEKEYFTNLLGIIDTKKATLFSEQTIIIRLIFQLYRRIGIILLSIYVTNICISGAVIYKNYYDKSSLFGFVTNALFIVFKMASILKIAIHSIKIPYSAYIESPVAFNSLKEEYIKPEIKSQYIFQDMEDYAAQNENAQYFMENRQYMKFLLENMEKKYDIELADMPQVENGIENIDIESLDTLEYTFTKRHHHSFS